MKGSGASCLCQIYPAIILERNMGVPRIPSQKKKYVELNKRLSQYISRVQKIYSDLSKSIAEDVISTGYDGSIPFSFSDYPELKKKIQDLQYQLVSKLRATIYSGTSSEWKRSNAIQDALAKKVLTYYQDQVNGEKHDTYFQTNSDALKAFQERKDKGMNLSAKLWRQSQEYKTALEQSISTAIERGTSAITLSKQVSQYLNDFPSMQRDYKEKFGEAATARDCEYRSIRLARSEINMAYRTAEQTRWRQFDFVKGYEIKLSKSHPAPDICDDLAGKYPKDFIWTGWHPNDLCYAIPIIASEEEYWGDVEPNNIERVPSQFKTWVEKNEEKLTSAEVRGTLPYFVTNNKGVVDNVIDEFNNGPALFKLDNENYYQLQERGFNIKVYYPFDKSPIRGFDMIDLNDFMDELSQRRNIKWQGKDLIVLDKCRSYFKFTGRINQRSDADFILERDINMEDGKRIAYHTAFVLPKVLQGKGISKAIFRKLFNQYERIGIDEVRVNANISVGGYAWAKYGFSAKTSEIKELMPGWINSAKLSQEEIADIEKILSQAGTYIRMDSLANLECGKKLLLGSHVSWDGFINLHDIKQIKYLHSYIGIED